MNLPELLESSTRWLAWGGLGFAGLTVLAFIARWGVRFRLVGVTSFTVLLASSSWAFTVSYTPPVVIEGALRVPSSSTTAMIWWSPRPPVISIPVPWSQPWPSWQAIFGRGDGAATPW